MARLTAFSSSGSWGRFWAMDARRGRSVRRDRVGRFQRAAAARAPMLRSSLPGRMPPKAARRSGGRRSAAGPSSRAPSVSRRRRASAVSCCRMATSWGSADGVSSAAASAPRAVRAAAARRWRIASNSSRARAGRKGASGGMGWSSAVAVVVIGGIISYGRAADIPELAAPMGAADMGLPPRAGAGVSTTRRRELPPRFAPRAGAGGRDRQSAAQRRRRLPRAGAGAPAFAGLTGWAAGMQGRRSA